MKCLTCNIEMIYKGNGTYKCPKCERTINDLVYRGVTEIKDYGFGLIKENQDMQFYQQGWICPKCGAVMAPHQSYCLFCQPQSKDIQVTTIGINPTVNIENKSISEVMKDETT